MKFPYVRAVALAILLAGTACSRKQAVSPTMTAGRDGLVAVDERSPHYAAVSSHLELGGVLYGYADVDGDAMDLAGSIQSLVHHLADSQAQLAPLDGQNFRALFADLGFNDIKALGFSSVREPSGVYRNSTFLYTPDGRHGLLAVLGGSPHPFTAAHMAPADTDYYMESDFDLRALYDTVHSVVARAGGSKAADSMDAMLKGSGANSGFSALDLIHGLKGRATVILRFDGEGALHLRGGPKPLQLPAFSGLVAVEGAGGAVGSALVASGSFAPSSDGGFQIYQPRSQLPVDGLAPVLAVKGKTLYVTTSVAFLKECLGRKEGLDTNPEFAAGLELLGPEGNGLTWESQRFFTKLRDLGSLNPDPTPEQKHIFDALALHIPIVNQGLLSVRTNLPDGVLVRSSWNRSLKADLAMVAIYNPVTVGLMAALAVPAYQRGQQAAHEHEVIENLRTLHEASRQYFADHADADSTTFEQLVGPGKAVAEVQPAMGEDYGSVTFQRDKPLVLRLPSGRVLVYPQGPAGSPPAPASASTAAITMPRRRPETGQASQLTAEQKRRYEQLAVLNNLYALDEAARKFRLQNKVDSVAYADLVGPGKLVPQVSVVAGEDYASLVFSRGEKVEVHLSDGRVIRYPIGKVAPESPAERSVASGPADDQALQVVENLRALYEAADKFYDQNQTTTTTYDRLVGPGRVLPSISPIAGEDYRSLLFKKGHPLRLYLKDGRVFSYPPQQAGP